MSRPVSKSVHQAVQNSLTVAQQGDEQAIAALQTVDHIDVIDDGETANVQLIIDQVDGDVVTEQGASFLLKSDD